MVLEGEPRNQRVNPENRDLVVRKESLNIPVPAFVAMEHFRSKV